MEIKLFSKEMIWCLTTPTSSAYMKDEILRIFWKYYLQVARNTGRHSSSSTSASPKSDTKSKDKCIVM